MKFSKFLLSLACALSLGSLASCQSDDEPVLEPGNYGKDEISFPVTMKLPDEIRTRAAAGGTVGSDGLYTFSRDIDKVWYAVYYNNKLVYHSGQEGVEQCERNGNNFTLSLKIHKDYDMSKVYLFFWAGNSQDNVKVNIANANGINLNFADRCVSVDPYYMNGSGSLAEYDSFAGYFQLSTTPTVTNLIRNYTLKRPFCQIHILSAEFTGSDNSASYPNGIKVIPGFGNVAVTEANYNSEMVSPTTWYFDGSLASNPSIKQNEFIFSSTNYESGNSLKGNSPERVTFNGKKMDYLACYYVFAPQVKQPLKAALNNGGKTYTKLNIAMRKPGDAVGKSEFASVNLPAAGLKANERYVVAGDGFFSETYNIKIYSSDTWDGSFSVEK